MSLTQNEIPAILSLAGNQIWADFSTNETDEDFIGIHYKVELFVGGSWVLLGQELRYEPDDEGKAIIDVHSLLEWDPVKEFTWSEDSSSLIHKRNNLRKSYHIAVYEKYGNPLTTHGSNAGTLRYVLPGKISDLRMGQLNDQSTSWWDIIQAQMFFLTNAPRVKTTDPWASERLFYIVSQGSSAKMDLNIKITYTDSTTKEIVRESTGSIAVYDVYEIITSFSTLGIHFLDPSKTIEKYEIWLTDNSSAIISEVYTYLVDHNRHDNSRYFLFSNGYKMIEGARFTGMSKTEAKSEYMSLSVNLEKDYGVKDPSASKSDIRETEYREVSSEWLTSEEINWLREMVLSREVYEIVNGEPVRIFIETDSVIPNEDNRNFKALVLSYRFAHPDSVPSILPRVEDTVANFQGAEIDLDGLTNGASPDYAFVSLSYNNSTGFLEAVSQIQSVPHAYSNNDIEYPCVPLLACYSAYTREYLSSVLQILLFDLSTYTQVGETIINTDPVTGTGFGILLSEEESVKFGVRGSAVAQNTHSMFLKLYIPTKRALEYLYELSI
ncbi:MAG: hypothetical protein V2B15_06510 [Bacteroidota bacterium]